MDIRLFFLGVVALFSSTAYSSPTTSECAEMKSHYNSVNYAEKQRLLRSCQDTYTPGVGWTNSATGCGRCPSASSSSNSAFCENSPSTCAEVAALGAMQNAVVQIGQGITNSILKNAIEKVENIQMDFINADQPVEEALYGETTRVSPPSGEEVSVGLNEAVTSLTNGFYSECVVPLFDHSKKAMGGWLYTVQSNRPLCKMKARDKNFHGNYFNMIKQATGEPAAASPYSIKEKKKGIDICQKSMGFSGGCSKKHSKDDFIYGTGFVSDRRQPNSDFWYRGGDDRTVHFEMTSTQGTRKFSHDRSSSNVFTCGEFALDINHSDNNAITFIRLQGSTADFAESCESEIFGGVSSLSR